VLRSQDPDAIAQELYAYLITYQAVRRLMHQAAVAADIDADRLSFTTALRAVRRFITSAATATGHLLAGLVDRAISQILEDQHERRDRAGPASSNAHKARTHPRNTPPNRSATPWPTPSKSSTRDDKPERLSSRHWGEGSRFRHEVDLCVGLL
jgi:hypothetical protein